MLRRAVLLAATFSLSLIAGAQEPAAAPEAAPEAAPAEDPGAALLASLKPQSGTVVLPGNLAELKLSDSFRYLSPGDAQRLIEQGWGNPPGSGDGTLGMIVPAAENPLGEQGWGVIVTYAADGHVADDDAASIDYADLLKDMKEATVANNEERAKAGYEAINLVGWAEPPRYDAGTKKIYWAKDLVFGDNENHTLNYYIRVLGREGVLELNAVAGMGQLDQVRESMKQVVGFADFTAGNRYADFNADTDQVAAYGLAALVAGGVAAKTGLLAKLLALLIAMKKLAIVAFAAVAGLVAKLFKRKGDGASPGGANPG
jgi:uncharacterized membrane-anchored protein